MSRIFSSKSYLVSLVNILDINGLTEVEENDSNDTLGCDDDAHKVVLCNHSLILHAWLLFWMKMVLLRLKKMIPMILLHVMTMLIKLF